MSNRLVRVLLSMVQFVGVAAFLVAEGIQLAGPGFTDRSLTINAISGAGRPGLRHPRRNGR